MGLFCGKTCQCKKRCEDYFTYQIDEHSSYTSSLAKLCQQACQSNKHITPEAFYEGLTPEQKIRYESPIPEYCQNPSGGLMTRAEVEESGFYYCLPYVEEAEKEGFLQEKKKQRNTGLFVFMFIAGIAFISFVIYKNS